MSLSDTHHCWSWPLRAPPAPSPFLVCQLEAEHPTQTLSHGAQQTHHLEGAWVSERWREGQTILRGTEPPGVGARYSHERTLCILVVGLVLERETVCVLKMNQSVAIWQELMLVTN